MPTRPQASLIKRSRSTKIRPLALFFGTTVASDPDANDSFVLTVSSGNAGGAFILDPTDFCLLSRRLRAFWISSPTTTYTLRLLATDAGGLTDTADVTISLLDLLEPPIAADQAFTAFEDAISGAFNPLGIVQAQ